MEAGREPSALLAYAVATVLRYLTPTAALGNGLFLGNLPRDENNNAAQDRTVYANNMYFDLSTGEYQFRNDCHADIPQKLHQIALSEKNNSIANLLAQLFNANSESNPLWQNWLIKANDFYFKILENERDGINQLQTLQQVLDDYHWLRTEELRETVTNIVNRTPAIDVHTHLFPQSHGPLLLCGIDELLTYHYLVAEYFMTAPLNVKPAGNKNLKTL
jgi:hypothetical protein